MYAGKPVFAQVMECAPWHTFRRLVSKYRGDFNVRSFSCLDQFLSMAFAQITYRESLRDIEVCIEPHGGSQTTSAKLGPGQRPSVRAVHKVCE